MTVKEQLVSEMTELAALLNWCLRTLRRGEINEAAYQQLNVIMESVQWALRLYFGENPFAEQQITIFEPDA